MEFQARIPEGGMPHTFLQGLFLTQDLQPRPPLRWILHQLSHRADGNTSKKSKGWTKIWIYVCLWKLLVLSLFLISLTVLFILHSGKGERWRADRRNQGEVKIWPKNHLSFDQTAVSLVCIFGSLVSLAKESNIISPDGTLVVGL